MGEHESPQDPRGCQAVIVLSDGARLILADGTVAGVNINNADTGEPYACVAPGEGVYADSDDNRVRIGLPTDDEAAEHPAVREALEELGVHSGGGDGRTVRMEGRGEIDPDVLSWNDAEKKPVVVQATPMPAPFEVETKEGTMRGDEGDILIRGVEGELYPCDSDIFYQTYEVLD